MFSSFNSAAFRLLLAVVLLSALPLGGYRPWAWSVIGVSVGALLLAWSVAVLAGRGRAPVPMGWLWAVAVPFAATLAWAFAQTSAAVPPALHHPLWDEAAQALGTPLHAGISIDPEMTRTAILRLASYGGVFWLAVQFGHDRSRAREALVAVALAGAAYAAYGLMVHFAGWERILWLDKWAYVGDLTATFVNRNAYGAYAGLGVLCCLALFLHALRPRRSKEARRAYEVVETVLLRALPFLICAVVVGTALLLSHSRGAFLSTGLGLLALMATAALGRVVHPRTALILCLAVAAIGLGVLSLSGDVTVQRLAETPTSAGEDARSDLYRLTMAAILDAPWTGHGLGAFLPAFRLYRDTSLADPPVVWDFAHNVHLETAMDLGLPATVALYAALAAVVGTCLRGLFRRRRDQIYPAVAIAAAVLIGAHGLVDFSAQMPAVAATLALLLGVGYAQSWRKSDGEPT